MKKTRVFLAISLIGLMAIFSGCNKFHHFYDDTPPSPPRDIWTVTGDCRVDIYWEENPENDVAGYNVYYSYSYDGKYTLIGSTESTHFIDDGAQNGSTYYYAVAAYDWEGNESDLSEDVVYDTPRPEGFNQALFDYIKSPNNSGYDFSKYLVLPYDDAASDFFFEKYNGKFYLDVWDDSDLQDMGSTIDIYDINKAPQGGWIPIDAGENIKYAEAKVGHTYVIWTWDNHYAKVRIKSISSERMVFDWAYQLAEGNRELKRIQKDERQNPPKEIKRFY